MFGSLFKSISSYECSLRTSNYSIAYTKIGFLKDWWLNLKTCVRNHNLNGISVVIPILNDDKRVKLCLGSLLNQTLSLDLVEIVLVRNFTSDKDSTRPLDKSIQTLLDKFTHVQIVFCELGNSNASNAGIEAAQFKFLTIVDCDDFVSLQFLEILLQGNVLGDSTHVVMSPIIDLRGIFHQPEIPTLPKATIRNRDAGRRRVSADSEYAALRLFTNQVTGKLFHAHVFCEDKFDPKLTVGMDTELASRLVRHQKVTSVSSSGRGCYYFRAVTFPSLSRPATRGYKFSITDRVAIITSLVPDFVERDSLSAGIIRSQGRYIRDYLELHTEQLAQVTKDIENAGFDQNFINELTGSAGSNL